MIINLKLHQALQVKKYKQIQFCINNNWVCHGKTFFLQRDLRPLERLITFYDCDLWMQKYHHKREQICQPSIAPKNHHKKKLFSQKKSLHHHFQPSSFMDQLCDPLDITFTNNHIT
jgi:hypothetical protein